MFQARCGCRGRQRGSSSPSACGWRCRNELSTGGTTEATIVPSIMDGTTSNSARGIFFELRTVLIGRLDGVRCHARLKQDVVPLDAAEDDVGIADINCKDHKVSSSNRSFTQQTALPPSTVTMPQLGRGRRRRWIQQPEAALLPAIGNVGMAEQRDLRLLLLRRKRKAEQPLLDAVAMPVRAKNAHALKGPQQRLRARRAPRSQLPRTLRIGRPQNSSARRSASAQWSPRWITASGRSRRTASCMNSCSPWESKGSEASWRHLLRVWCIYYSRPQSGRQSFMKQEDAKKRRSGSFTPRRHSSSLRCSPAAAGRRCSRRRGSGAARRIWRGRSPC